MRQILILAFQVSILSTVFGFGLKTAPADLMNLLHRPGLLVRSVIAVLVVMPVLATLLTELFDIRHAAEIVLLALAISPVPPLLPRREAKAGGQQSYGLALMVILGVLAIVAVPLWVELLQRVFDRPLRSEPVAVGGLVIKMIVAPLVAGMLVRSFLPDFARRIDKPVVTIAKVLLPIAVVVLLAATWRAVWSATGGGTIIAMVVFVLAGLAVGHLLGGPDPEHSVVLALSSACRHPAIALLIASKNFPSEQLVGTILLYVLLNTIVGIPYLAWVRKQYAVPVTA
jgi:BASS family bile acid:Na+ symporter